MAHNSNNELNMDYLDNGQSADGDGFTTYQLVLVLVFNTSFHAFTIWSRFLAKSSDDIFILFIFYLRQTFSSVGCFFLCVWFVYAPWWCLC